MIVSLLIAVVVLCLVIWVAQSLLAAFSVPDPIRTVVLVVVVILMLLWFMGAAGLPVPRIR